MPSKILITVTLRGEVVQQHAAGRMGTTIIGRTPSCDVVLDNPGVSRTHAEISFRDDAFHFEDLGSANGSLVNGSSVEEAALKDGDVLTISKYVLHVAIPSEEPDNVDNPYLRDPTIQVDKPAVTGKHK